VSNPRPRCAPDHNSPPCLPLPTVCLEQVLKKEVNNPRLRWAYLPYSMHMAGPREAIQHMIIRKNFGGCLYMAAAKRHLAD